MNLITKITEAWAGFEGTTKFMAIGTFVLVICSILLTIGNCSASEPLAAPVEAAKTETAAEQEALIPEDADPIPIASYESRLATTLVDILAHKDCLWASKADEVRWIEFTTDSFTEHNGDMTKTAAFEIYSIEAIENGREGTWRLTYENGTTKDATFRFIQDREAGEYIITSSAFSPYAEGYTAAAITSEDVLSW